MCITPAAEHKAAAAVAVTRKVKATIAMHHILKHMHWQVGREFDTTVVEDDNLNYVSPLNITYHNHILISPQHHISESSEYHSTVTATATAKSIETVTMMSEIGAREVCLHQGMLGQGQGMLGAVVDG